MTEKLREWQNSILKTVEIEDNLSYASKRHLLRHADLLDLAIDELDSNAAQIAEHNSNIQTMKKEVIEKFTDIITKRISEDVVLADRRDKYIIEACLRVISDVKDNMLQHLDSTKTTSSPINIVRCRNCCYANDDGTICRYGVGNSVKPDHFCANGELRDDKVM